MTTGPAMASGMSVSSIHELAAAGATGVPPAARSAFAIDLLDADRIELDERGWAETAPTLRAPREAVERQRIVFVRDRLTGREVVLNPLRSRRVAPSSMAGPSAAPGPCRWCDPDGWHVTQPGRWTEAFGDVAALGGRVLARPNWARQAPASGLAFGDHDMHDLLRLRRDELVGLFDAAEQYIVAARRARPELDHFMVFLNGGARAAASVEHAHLQIVGRPGRHFAYAEDVAARAPADYWQRIQAAHEALGLAAAGDGTTAWASLVPAKERDVTVISRSLVEGAARVHAVLQTLIRHGSNTFSVAAILAPPAVPRFAAWPPVVWRIVDRGDRAVRHADIGCMELFGTPVVATDPFVVAAWLGARR